MKQTLSSRCALPRLGAEYLLAINIPNLVATTIPSARLPPVRIAPKAARYSRRVHSSHDSNRRYLPLSSWICSTRATAFFRLLWPW
jgi:hypothetical protein